MRAAPLAMFVATAAAQLLGFAGVAHACSCYPPPPPCEAFWEADAVFIGKVAKISPRRNYLLAVEFDVQEWFRGGVGKHAVVGTSASGGACGAEFQTGAIYVVYANGSAPDRLSTHLCSRTSQLGSAAADLDYARNRGKSKKAVLSGLVSFRNASGVSAQSDAEVRLSPASPKMPAVRTSEGGRFRIEVEPGTYEFEVSRPGMRMTDPGPAQRKVELPERGACVTRNATLVIDGRIRGRVTDANGVPLPDIPVEATGVGMPNFLNWTDRTDERGEYELTGVGTGSYNVGVSIRHGLTPSVPYPVTYFPGAAATEKGVVQLLGSEVKQGIDITLADRLAVHELIGFVSWPDGSPASDVVVMGPHHQQARTDTAGRFQISAFEGSAAFEVSARRDRVVPYVGTRTVEVRGPRRLSIHLRPR